MYRKAGNLKSGELGFLTNHARVQLYAARDPRRPVQLLESDRRRHRATGIAAIRRISISPAVIGRRR